MLGAGTGCGACTDEIQRLVDERILSPMQADMVDAGKITNLFASPFGKKLRNSTNILWVFKFSILDDSSSYFPELSGEQILLQGVVDCALIEVDGITVIDFKTDKVSEDTVPVLIQRYRTQVCIYVDALSRIYKLPIKAKYLYLFGIDSFVEIP